MQKIDFDFRVLLKNLEEQLILYSELLNLAEKKTDILVKNDVKHLEEITNMEQEMIVKLGKLEEERCKFLEELSSHLGIEKEKINSSYILEILPEKVKKEMDEITNKLKDVLKNLDERNRLNERLIKSALEFINTSIELLVEAGRQVTGYGADGKISEKETLKFFDKKL